MDRTYHYQFPFPAILVACCLAACSGPAEEQATKTAAAHEPESANLVPPIIEENPTKDVVKSVEDEFKDVVHHGTPSSHTALSAATLKFTVESFQSIVSGMSCPSGNETGVVVHYGFNDASKTITFAYSFVCLDMDREIGKYSVPGSPVYTVDGSHKLVDTQYASLSAWQNGPGKAFQDKVVVDKYDNHKFEKIYASTWAHMVYKTKQVQSLIDDNSLADTDFVEVVPIAEPELWSRDCRGAKFSMRTCLVARDASDRLLNDDPATPGAVFKNRGSDLGSACPPMCDQLAVFVKNGILTRDECY